MTGEIASLPETTGQTNDKRCTFQLQVRHRTSNETIKRELFDIHCWGGTAEWAMRNLRLNQQILLDGVYTSYATTYSQSIIQASVTAPMKPAVVLA